MQCNDTHVDPCNRRMLRPHETKIKDHTKSWGRDFDLVPCANNAVGFILFLSFLVTVAFNQDLGLKGLFFWLFACGMLCYWFCCF